MGGGVEGGELDCEKLSNEPISQFDEGGVSSVDSEATRSLAVNFLYYSFFTERIILEVNNNTAKKWRFASIELRTKLNNFMDEALAKILEDNRNVDTIQFLMNSEQRWLKKN